MLKLLNVQLRQTILSLISSYYLYWDNKIDKRKRSSFQGLSGNTWSVFIKFCFAAFPFKANANFDCVNRAEVQLGIIIETLHKKINTFGYFYYMRRWSIFSETVFILLSPGKIIVPPSSIFFRFNFKSAQSLKRKLILKPQFSKADTSNF